MNKLRYLSECRTNCNLLREVIAVRRLLVSKLLRGGDTEGDIHSDAIIGPNHVLAFMYASKLYGSKFDVQKKCPSAINAALGRRGPVPPIG